MSKPVIVAVGKVPMSPVIVVAPVLVIPDPARTAKPSAVPSPTDVAAWALPATAMIRPLAVSTATSPGPAKRVRPG